MEINTENAIIGIDFWGLDRWESCAYVGRVNVTLDNVEDRYVTCRLARYGGNHPVFGL